MSKALWWFFYGGSFGSLIGGIVAANLISPVGLLIGMSMCAFNILGLLGVMLYEKRHGN